MIPKDHLGNQGQNGGGHALRDSNVVKGGSFEQNLPDQVRVAKGWIVAGVPLVHHLLLVTDKFVLEALPHGLVGGF